MVLKIQEKQAVWSIHDYRPIGTAKEYIKHLRKYDGDWTKSVFKQMDHEQQRLPVRTYRNKKDLDDFDLLGSGRFPSLIDVYTNINGLKRGYIIEDGVRRDPTTKSNIASKISWIWVDLDNPDRELNFLSKVMERLNNDQIWDGVPLPDMVLDSGNGAWLFWRIRNSSNYIDIAEDTMKALVKIFEPYGADPACTNVNRICRVAGTLNSKTGRLVKALARKYDNEGHWLIEFNHLIPQKPKISNVVQFRPKPRRKWKEKLERSVVFDWNNTNLIKPQQLAEYRYQDLLKLFKGRSGKQEGIRTMALFILCTSQATKIPLTATEEELEWYAEQIKPKLEKLNGLFADPLPAKKIDMVLSQMTSYRNNDWYGIRWTSDGIIGRLKISPEEQKELKAIKGEEEKKRRDRERKEKERRAKGGVDMETFRNKQKAHTQSLKDQVHALREEGNSYNAIAKQLGISKASVIRYSKQ